MSLEHFSRLRVVDRALLQCELPSSVCSKYRSVLTLCYQEESENCDKACCCYDTPSERRSRKINNGVTVENHLMYVICQWRDRLWHQLSGQTTAQSRRSASAPNEKQSEKEPEPNHENGKLNVHWSRREYSLNKDGSYDFVSRNNGIATSHVDLL